MRIKKVDVFYIAQQIPGIDLRGCSFYGLELCAGHFCPRAISLFRRSQSQILIKIIDDWYLYGLV